MKKFIAFLTLICMLLSFMPLAALAEETDVIHDADSHEYSWDADAKKYVCECGDVYRRFVLDLDGDGTATVADAIFSKSKYLIIFLNCWQDTSFRPSH